MWARRTTIGSAGLHSSRPARARHAGAKKKKKKKKKKKPCRTRYPGHPAEGPKMQIFNQKRKGFAMCAVALYKRKSVGIKKNNKSS